MLRRLLLVFLFASSALTAGCVGPGIQPRPEALKGMTEIVIVPMEAPPLYIGPGYAATGSASIVHFLPRYTIGMARAVGVLSGVAVLLAFPRRRIARWPTRRLPNRPEIGFLRSNWPRKPRDCFPLPARWHASPLTFNPSPVSRNEA